MCEPHRVRLDDLGRATFRLTAPAGTAMVTLPLVGGHHVGNALAAAAVALECGLSVPAIAEALSAAGPRSRWRMELVERADGVVVINDAYNANPESVRAALKTLAAIGRARPGAHCRRARRDGRAGRGRRGRARRDRAPRGATGHITAHRRGCGRPADGTRRRSGRLLGW